MFETLPKAQKIIFNQKNDFFWAEFMKNKITSNALTSETLIMFAKDKSNNTVNAWKIIASSGYTFNPTNEKASAAAKGLVSKNVANPSNIKTQSMAKDIQTVLLVINDFMFIFYIAKQFGKE